MEDLSQLANMNLCGCIPIYLLPVNQPKAFVDSEVITYPGVHSELSPRWGGGGGLTLKLFIIYFLF
jgi:hypothetical protein